MKVSRYNVVAPAYSEQGGILFNTATQACLLLDDEELASYWAIARGETEKSSLFDELVRQRFLIDPKTENSYMHHVYRRSKFDNGMLELQICPSLDQDPERNAVFERSREGAMAQRVQDALLAFVHEHYARSPFLVFKVVWVLGEKLIGLDVVKQLSEQFQGLSEDLEVEYRSSALVAGEADVSDLAVRFEGCVIDRVDNVKTYQHCLHSCAVPSENEDFQTKATPLDPLQDLDGIESRDNSDFRNRALSLLERNDFQNFTRDDFEQFLIPLRRYCSASTEYSWAIDELGNAYGTTRDLGKDDRVLFNVCKPVELRPINRKLIATYGLENPLDVLECATCRVYPLCGGGCAHMRVEEGVLTCIPMRYAIEEFLTAYSRVL